MKESGASLLPTTRRKKCNSLSFFSDPLFGTDLFGLRDRRVFRYSYIYLVVQRPLVNMSFAL